jgi:hypothetical protein
MLVDVLESLPARDDTGAPVQDDAGVDRALKGLSAAIESDDSLFQSDHPIPHVVGDALCTADFVLSFRDHSFEGSRQLHLSLVEKLVELLQGAGSAETLAARLCLTKRGAGMTLQMRLEARGNSSEQARLRWALGVAHVQQALLFTSRYLRQQIGQSSD